MKGVCFFERTSIGVMNCSLQFSKFVLDFHAKSASPTSCIGCMHVSWLFGDLLSPFAFVVAKLRFSQMFLAFALWWSRSGVALPSPFQGLKQRGDFDQ